MPSAAPFVAVGFSCFFFLAQSLQRARSTKKPAEMDILAAGVTAAKTFSAPDTMTMNDHDHGVVWPPPMGAKQTPFMSMVKDPTAHTSEVNGIIVAKPMIMQAAAQVMLFCGPRREVQRKVRQEERERERAYRVVAECARERGEHGRRGRAGRGRDGGGVGVAARASAGSERGGVPSPEQAVNAPKEKGRARGSGRPAGPEEGPPLPNLLVVGRLRGPSTGDRWGRTVVRRGSTGIRRGRVVVRRGERGAPAEDA